MKRVSTIRAIANVAVALVAVALLAIVAPALLMLSPAVALLVLVVMGLFPSAELIAALRRRRRRARVARPEVAPPTRPVSWVRPGQIIAFGLAVRPPPTRGLAFG